MRFLKVISVILGLVLALAGAASVASGAFIFSVYHSHSTPSGFFVTPSQTVGSNGFALTAPNISTQLSGTWARRGLSWARPTLRVTGSSQLPAAIFIGVAPTSQVSAYLSGVTRDRVKSIDLGAGSVDYEHVDGTKLPSSPLRQSFWAAKASGTGSQTLEWKLQEGDWTVVIMNADASAPVVADMTLAARFGVITPLIVGLVAGGVVLLAVGATLVVLGARRRRTVPARGPLGAPSRDPYVY